MILVDFIIRIIVIVIIIIVTKREDEKNINYKDLTIEIQRMCSVETKVILSVSGNWNNLEVVHTIPEQHPGKAVSQGTTEISHI